MPQVGNFRDRSAAGPPACFKKLKDDQRKNSPKRLQHNAHKKRIIDRKCIQKLLSSIKKKYLMKSIPPFRRRLEFRKDLPDTEPKMLPAPKFYRPPKACGSSSANLNDSIEEGEIIELDRSDNDDDDNDCVLLEPSMDFINIADDDDDDDESDGEPSTSERCFKTAKRRAELHSSPEILFKDCFRQTELLRKFEPKTPLLYSTIAQRAASDDGFATPKPKKSLKHNDSIIVINDSITDEDFIPLPPNEPISKSPKKKKKKISKRMNDSLFTSAEKKQLGKYNGNTFNPADESEGTENEPKSNKRAVIIDGSNVAFAHGNSNIFSSEGIKYCLQYFEKMGHSAKAVIPMFRKNATKSSNPELLDKLHKEGKIVFTPCKNLPGQMSSSYDDRFILQLAYELNAAVVSNDNYRDLINENPAFKKIVESRVLGYSWCDNIFILPKDPYGRWGPTLDQILKC